jgi:AcrR family transcriptional regulator
MSSEGSPTTLGGVSGGHTAEALARGRGARKSPKVRRADILASARRVFEERGYVESGVAEVAKSAQVSKSLLYHYFPGGRPQLFVRVIDDLVEELTDELRRAARVPFSPQARMTHLLSAIFTFFGEKPAAYRLLFRDPAVSHEPDVESAALTARATIAGELAVVLAESDLAPHDVVAASSGILGFALSNVELCLAGRLEPEHAWQVSCAFCLPPLATP